MFSHFNYCLLVWMFTNKTNNKLIENICIIALRASELDFISSGDELLFKNSSIHI